MNHIIEFKEKISSYYIYSEVLDSFFKIYKEDDVIPEFDFENVLYITTSAIPIIMVLGEYLNRLYDKPVELHLGKNKTIYNFLYNIRFLEISEKRNIFKIHYAPDIQNQVKELRDIHEISYTYTMSEYSDATKIKDLVQRKNYIYDCLIERERVAYRTILNDTHKLSDQIIDMTIHSIAEIKTNAIIHSGSSSFTYVASDKYGTNVCIADCGIGFEKSFNRDSRQLEMCIKFSHYPSYFKNYLVIMSVLYYSFKKHLKDGRKDIWILKKDIIDSNGSFKIHYRNTQVVFTGNICKKCNNNSENPNIENCVECLYRRYKKDLYSPIKIFNVGIQGVQIEISINRE